MSKPIQISIPTPCHEKWAEMTSTDKGRFCASCQKNVIDFTRAPDREIANTLKADKNLCGRFLPSQLERDLIIAKEKSSLWAVAGAAVLAFLSFGSTQAKAQSYPTEQIDTNSRKKVAALDVRPIVNGSIILNNKSVKVIITNKNTLIQTTTDENGSFMIRLNEGDVLEFTCEGYENQTVTYNNKKALEVYMVPIQEIVYALGGPIMGIEIKESNTIRENRPKRSIWDLFN